MLNDVRRGGSPPPCLALPCLPASRSPPFQSLFPVPSSPGAAPPLSLLFPFLPSFPPFPAMPDQISVSEFVSETNEDYKSPTASNFTTRMVQCRNTVTAIEEVSGSRERRRRQPSPAQPCSALPLRLACKRRLACPPVAAPGSSVRVDLGGGGKLAGRWRSGASSRARVSLPSLPTCVFLAQRGLRAQLGPLAALGGIVPGWEEASRGFLMLLLLPAFLGLFFFYFFLGGAESLSLALLSSQQHSSQGC